MAKSPVEVWLWLLLVMKPFNRKTNYILEKCGGDALQACRNIRDGKYDFLSDAEKNNAKNVRTKDVRELLSLCEKHGVRVITLDDAEYPRLLREIEYPPIVLFAAGSLAGLDNTITLSAVGARNVSEYGVKVAHRFIEPLARLGVAVISGMAVGTDAEVHKACLAAGGRTIGVLGCGILVDYPAENAELKRMVVENGGALISELLPTAKTFPAYFNIRNRIISGLSLGTLVIEAGEKSGSLLTAHHAAAQSREVFCVPPQDVFSTRFNGVVPLLRDGALPVYNFTDIVSSFAMYFSNESYIKDRADEIERELRQNKPLPKPRKKQSDGAEAPEKAKEAKPVAPSEELLSSLDGDEAAVLKLICASSAKPDVLIEKSGLEYDALSEILTNLEIMGHIKRAPGGEYSAAI